AAMTATRIAAPAISLPLCSTVQWAALSAAEIVALLKRSSLSECLVCARTYFPSALLRLRCYRDQAAPTGGSLRALPAPVFPGTRCSAESRGPLPGAWD